VVMGNGLEANMFADQHGTLYFHGSQYAMRR
jgi:hypothetical protein